MQRSETVAGGDGAIRPPRLLKGPLANIHDQRVQCAVVPVHAVEVVTQQFLAAEFARANPGGQFGCGEKGEIAHGTLIVGDGAATNTAFARAKRAWTSVE